MGNPKFFVAPGFGDTFRQTLHFSIAVKIGNRVETSGCDLTAYWLQPDCRKRGDLP